MGRHATPDTARTECSDSRHDLRADVTSPQATVQRDEGHHSNLTVDEPTVNALHAATRVLAERANSLLKAAFNALRRISLCPWRIGTAAALVLLHREHNRTT
jgi:hypothetical protein